MEQKLPFFAYLRLKLMALLLRAAGYISHTLSMIRDRPIAADIRRERVRIPSRDPGRYITAYLYHPPLAESEFEAKSGPAASDGPRPILVNWHGSGFAIPALESDTVFCAKVARDAGIFVLDADYRKGPETPFPGPLHDVEDTLRWVATQRSQFDTTRVAVSGFSAGGNLALAASSELRKTLLTQQQLDIKAVVSVYPLTDLTAASEAKRAPKPRKVLPVPALNFFNDCYVPVHAMRKDPRVSPLLAESAGFPDTVAILTCEGDVYAPEGVALARKLDDGHRTVVSRMLEGVHHGFDNGTAWGTEDWERREEAYALAVETLKGALGC